jgi:2-polyprenyl-3-methyl-5-hydroxy-6-metoxy-1,4-benzoquinol methylase
VRALALYRKLPLSVRLHTIFRAWTCPMAAVLARVPTEGRLLEVGCGHGLFANEAALGRPGLSVIGIDPAEEKIRWAETTVGSRTNVTFRCGRVEEMREYSFDAVAVLDVLYLIPRASWAAFLTACGERLRPGGRLVLKDVDTVPRWKFYRCLVQETLSVRAMRITLGRKFAFAPRGELTRVLREADFRDVTTTDLGTGYMTPHVLYEATRR